MSDVSSKKERKERRAGSKSVKKTVRSGKLGKHPKAVGRNSDIASSPPDDATLLEKKKKRKAHKWKAGTLAAMEVKRFQTGKKATCPIITKQAIEDLMRDTLGDCGAEFRLQKGAIPTMRSALEDEAIRLFQCSRLLAAHAHRKTIDVKDMHIIAKIRQIYPGTPSSRSGTFFHKNEEKVTPQQEEEEEEIFPIGDS